MSLDVNSATVTYRSCDYVLLAFVTLQWKAIVLGDDCDPVLNAAGVQ